MVHQWNTHAVLKVVMTSYLILLINELGSRAALVCMPADLTLQIVICCFYAKGEFL